MDNQRHWIGYDTFKLIVALILLVIFIMLLLQGGAQAPIPPAAIQAATAAQASSPTTAPTATLAPSPVPPSPTAMATPLPSPTPAPTATPQPAPTQTPEQKATPTSLSTSTPTRLVPATQNVSSLPAVTVVDLQSGKRVRLQFANLPANVEFAVRLGASGAAAAGASAVAHITSPDGSPVVFWIEISPELASSSRIDVRIDSAAGLSATTSFDNLAVALAAPTATATTTTFVANPVITVLHVQKGGIVIAAVSGLPANTNYSVTVGKAGTQGVDGYVIAHLYSGSIAGVSLVGTYEIPASLRNEATLDLRLDAGGAVYVVSFKNIDF
jgi:hypothetical protein